MVKMAIAGVVISLALSGCTTYWTKPGATDSALMQAAYECERDARQSNFDNGFAMLAFQERCMKARGWIKTTADGTPR